MDYRSDNRSRVFGIKVHRQRKVDPQPSEVNQPGAPAPAPPPDSTRVGETKKKAGRFRWASQGPAMFGLKLGSTLAVTAVVLGTLLGTPEGRTPTPTPTPIEVRAEPSPEIRQGVKIVRDAMKLIAPESLTREQAMSNLGHITFAVRTGPTPLRANDDGTGLQIAGGTRLSVGLNRHQLTIYAEPGVTWGVPWRPDPNIESLSFDFHTGQFSTNASGLGPDEWYQEGVLKLINRDLLPRLPEPMRRPGYDPYADPQLEQNLEQLVANFTALSSDATSRAGRHTDFSVLETPEVSFDFRVPNERRVDLGGGHTAWFAAGTRVQVHLSTSGALTDPKLSHLSISFDKPVVVGEGEGRPGMLGRLELNAIHLMPNGQLSLDYELGAEQAVDGTRALLLLAIIAMDPAGARMAGNANLSPTRMEAIRAKVNGVVDTQLEPQLVDQIRINDQAIAGLSLLRFFDIR